MTLLIVSPSNNPNFSLYRYNDPNEIIRKPFCKPIPAYENCIECQTLQDLEAIKRNQNALHMESLSIRERILGRHNPEIPHPVIFRGAVFADNARFDRCIELWLHALNLKQLNEITVTKDLLRFAQVQYFFDFCYYFSYVKIHKFFCKV